MSLFSWNTMLFLIPMAVGLAFLIGGALGLSEHSFGDADTDADAEADADSDADVDADADASLLELLGVGRVPLSLLITTLLFAFGGIGLSLTQLTLGWLGATAATLLGAAVALIGAPIATGLMARSIARAVPATETYAESIEELVGSVALAELEIGPDFGVASVVDRGGAQIKIRCRTEAGRIGKGERLLLLEYDAPRSVFVVEKSPV